MYCSKCGKPNAESAKFCESCGALLEETLHSQGQPSFAPSSSPNPQKKKKRIPTFLKVILGVVISFVLLVILVAIFVPDPEDDNSTDPLDSSVSDLSDTEQSSRESDSTNPSKSGEFHLYDSAYTPPVLNGYGSKIGEYSLIKYYSDVTDEELVDWYENHVSLGDYNYYLIVFTDKDEKEGIYAIPGMIEKNVTLEKNPDNAFDYSFNDENAEIYYVSDGKLVRLFESDSN